MGTQTITLEGRRYVVLPEAEYAALTQGAGKARKALPPGTVEAIPFATQSIATALKRARETAGLTQLQLAEKLGKSQTLVARAEGGQMKVTEKYVAKVLEACGLPEDWSDNPPAKAKRVRA